MPNEDLERRAREVVGLEKAIVIVERHVERARKAVAECPRWSPAQAEWSRARDLGLDIADDIRTLLQETDNA